MSGQLFRSLDMLPPDASNLPSGLKATPYTGAFGSLRGEPMGKLSETSQRRIVLSSPADATVVESGLNATLHTVPRCLLRRGPYGLRLETRQSSMESPLAEAMNWPLGLKATS